MVVTLAVILLNLGTTYINNINDLSGTILGGVALVMISALMLIPVTLSQVVVILFDIFSWNYY